MLLARRTFVGVERSGGARDYSCPSSTQTSPPQFKLRLWTVREHLGGLFSKMTKPPTKLHPFLRLPACSPLDFRPLVIWTSTAGCHARLPLFASRRRLPDLPDTSPVSNSLPTFPLFLPFSRRSSIPSARPGPATGRRSFSLRCQRPPALFSLISTGQSQVVEEQTQLAFFSRRKRSVVSWRTAGLLPLRRHGAIRCSCPSPPSPPCCKRRDVLCNLLLEEAKSASRNEGTDGEKRRTCRIPLNPAAAKIAGRSSP